MLALAHRSVNIIQTKHSIIINQTLQKNPKPQTQSQGLPHLHSCMFFYQKSQNKCLQKIKNVLQQFYQNHIIKSLQKMQTKRQEQCSQWPSQPFITSPVKTTKHVLQTIYGSRLLRNNKQLTPLNTSAQKKQSVSNKSIDYYTFQRSLINAKNRVSVPVNQIHASNANNNMNSNVNANANPNANTNPNSYQSEKYTYTYRKTFSVSKQSTTQIQNMQVGRNASKGGIINFSKILVNNTPNVNATNKSTVHTNSNANIRSSFSTYKPTTPSTIPTTTNMANKLPTPKTKSTMNNTTTGFHRTTNPLSPPRTPLSPKKPPHTHSPHSHTLTPSSTPSSKPHNKMNMTAQNFRPPTTSNYIRQCNNQAQDHNNYLNKYQIIKELGKGTYGVVHLAKKKCNKERGMLRSGGDLMEGSGFGYGSVKQRDSVYLEEDGQKDKDSQKCSIQLQKVDNNEQDTDNQNISLINQVSQQTKQSILPQIAIRCLSPSIILQSNSNHHEPTASSPKQPQPLPTDQLFAIKIYQKFKMTKDPTKFKNIRKQITIMQNINHPNIIKLYQSVQTLTKINIVVEYGGNQSLLDYLKNNYPLSDTVMRRIGMQLLNAIVYLHEKNIVHRDLKLQNILMLGGQVKIIDFGFSTLTFKNRKLNAICGTPNYMAPQVLAKKEYIGELADVWSYGVVMFTIAEGRHPFKAQTYNQLQRLVNKGNYQFKRTTNSIHQAFIKRILKTKPQERPRAIDLLSHPWLQIKDQPEGQLNTDTK